MKTTLPTCLARGILIAAVAVTPFTAACLSRCQQAEVLCALTGGLLTAFALMVALFR